MTTYWKTRDVARLLDVEMSTVLAYVENGTIPPSCYLRLGGTPRGRLRFKPDELRELLESWQPAAVDFLDNRNGPAARERPDPGNRRSSPDARARLLRALD